MKLISYYEEGEWVTTPKIKEIKEKQYDEIGLWEYNVYFEEMFAVKDVIIIGVNYIKYYEKERLVEKFSIITPVELKDPTYYPIPKMLCKIIRDKVKIIK